MLNSPCLSPSLGRACSLAERTSQNASPTRKPSSSNSRRHFLERFFIIEMVHRMAGKETPDSNCLHSRLPGFIMALFCIDVS